MWAPILLAVLLVAPVHPAKILGVFHMSARSHYILGSSLMRALAERGHEVTVISAFGEKDPPKNTSYRDIVLEGFAEEHDKKIKDLKMFEQKKPNPITMLPKMVTMLVEMTEQTLNNTKVVELMESGETFDMVIMEEFMNQAHKALAPHFKAHLVLLSTIGANTFVNELVGNPTPLAYVPDLILGYSSHMTFLQRLINSLTYVAKGILTHCVILPRQKELVSKYFPNGPPLEQVLYNASLVLLNSHPSTNQPVPYVPQMVDIGGFHVSPPKKLPKHLQEYLDNSKTGVIYFSLGSNMKSSLLPEEKRQAFIDTFSQLKEDVLWKWEEDDLPNKPKNVRTEKWLPQQDILAHPNIKLFITHAGLLSTIETIYHGVPSLAIPIGGDQNLNAKQMENQGVGLKLEFQNVTTEGMMEKIHRLLKDPSFRKNAQERSKFFHDRQVKPMDLAVYWVEYVLRHGGTTHLRVAGLDLPWYQYLLLDVIAVVATIGVVLGVLFCKGVKKLCCKGKKVKKEKVKKQ